MVYSFYFILRHPYAECRMPSLFNETYFYRSKWSVGNYIWLCVSMGTGVAEGPEKGLEVVNHTLKKV